MLEAILVNRIGLEHLELRNASEITSTLFQDWIQGYNPDREASMFVDAMIDADLGYLSSSSGPRPATVVYGGHKHVTSDSESAAFGSGGGPPTVIFRGRFYSSRRKFFQSSASETDTTSMGLDVLKTSLILSDAARSMDSLKTLTLTGASRLSDTSIDRLSLMMTYMQDLTISDSNLLTEECVEPIKRRCKLLRSLHITGTKLRVRIDSSRFYNRQNRRKSGPPSSVPITAKRKHKDSDTDDD
jgi:hypothetical protein